MRTGTNDTHITFQNIKELRKLIKTTLPQKTSDRRYPVIAPACLPVIAVIVHSHASELITPKRLIIAATSQLLKKYRSPTLGFNNNTYNRNQPTHNKHNYQ